MTKWKIGNFLPLFKQKGNRYDCDNSRPIYLLSSLSKVMEKVVYMKIHEYMDRTGLYHPLQFAYRKLISTVNALFT